MFSFFKKFFYKKECYACKTLIEKITCVREHLLIDPYSKEYRSLKLKFIHANIEDTINELKALKNSMEIGSYIIPKIAEINVKEYYISKWFTDNEKNILSNTEVTWKEYLDLYIWLITWYNENSTDLTKSTYGVSLKIKPYIINIDIVVNALIEYQKQELDV